MILPESIVFDFVDAADDVTVISRTFEKRTHADNDAFYKDAVLKLDPTLPKREFTLRQVEAKVSPQFFGVRRFYTAVREEFSISTPSGDTGVFPLITKVERSIPVGISLVNQANHLRLVDSILSSGFHSQNFTINFEI